MTKMIVPVLTMLLLSTGFNKIPDLFVTYEEDDYLSVYGMRKPLTYYSDLYGPFPKFPSSAPDFNLYINRKSNHSDFNSMCVHFNLYTLKNNKIALTRYYEHLTFDENKKITVPLSFELNQNFSLEGIKVDLEIYSEINDFYKEKLSFKLYPSENGGSYSLKDYSSATLKFNDSAVEIKDNSIKTYQEAFTFGEYRDYFLLDHYYHLRFTQFNFSYSFAKNFTYTSASMTIKDAPSCFSNLKMTQNDDDIQIPLEAYLTEENKIGLRFGAHLFVDKNTLEMAYFPLNNNYVSTNTFFLPKNRAAEVDGTKFKFVIEGCGYEDFKLSWEVTFDSLRYLIGNCSDSEYCVIEGVVD